MVFKDIFGESILTDDDWYYATHGKKMGPVAQGELVQLIGSGEINPTSLVWCTGMSEWEPASLHFVFKPHNVPPPLPVGTPQLHGFDHPSNGPNTINDSFRFRHEAPSRDFIEAIHVCFHKYAEFSGRASRSEYWYFVLFNLLLRLIVLLIQQLDPSSIYESFNTITFLGLLLPTLAVQIRRLHDIGRSGWWVGGFWISVLLLSIFFGIISEVAGKDSYSVNIIGAIFMVGILGWFVAMIVFLCQRGQDKINQYN